MKTAQDMDFYDVLTEDYEDKYQYYPTQAKGEEEELLALELDEKRREVIRKEIDSRSGRLWEDPWEITDADWSSGRSYDDLPDWTEEICSRVNSSW